jgi:nucleoid-associated protein YgaU
VGKALLSSVALILLLVGLAFGAYRTFWGSAFGKVQAALHDDASAPINAPFEVRVEANQSIGSIARQYLGEFNAERLRQIRALNPSLTNPDHVQVGQKVLLPGPRPSSTIGQAHDTETNKGEQ